MYVCCVCICVHIYLKNILFYNYIATPCPVTITSERYNRQENKVVVRFASDDPDATFECELDGKGRAPCMYYFN